MGSSGVYVRTGAQGFSPSNPSLQIRHVRSLSIVAIKQDYNMAHLRPAIVTLLEKRTSPGFYRICWFVLEV